MYHTYWRRKSFELGKFFRVAVFAAFFLTNAIQYSPKAQTKFQRFKQATRPVKCWVISHPFIAKKTFRISERALILADSMRKSPVLDGNFNGGQVDAFRHGIWMAMLSQEFPERKAKGLGEAYEKGNHLMFKRKKLEDGALQDAAASKMDLWNNAVGLRIGKTSPLTEAEMVAAVIAGILKGDFKKIYANARGEMLDCNGNVLQVEAWKGKWENLRCLVSSNTMP